MGSFSHCLDLIFPLPTSVLAIETETFETLLEAEGHPYMLYDS